MVLLPYELSSVVNDMHQARDAKLYYPCLLVALTLPEICSGLLLPKNSLVKQVHYVDFVNTYSSPQELGDDGLGVFRLRGGLVHRGDMRGHPHYRATHVIFSVPEASGKIHGVSIEAGQKTAAMFDLDTFIAGMDAAVRRWYIANKNDAQLSENLPHLIRYSPTGVSPFTKGLSAIVSGS
ncbi:MAG: hypothetical protein U0934_10025 [Pseudotabrizicola sp.]|uniref:hypothetical protein n=1 Tax=Pseudotabrizicola sp. TaxID=2939647 RepID=UPI002731D33C|nr:hypothetical protein [Pseudotabrizicola sp.]MDP2082393.1 hypothetical protein [Pseudotabrizicola sp.]MDZ7574280.1 hypothetical protein [Pseudotabrizicola sp.]